MKNGMQDHDYPRLTADPKKHESKNNGNFYKGSTSNKNPKKSKDYTTSVSKGRSSKRGSYAS